ncbi:MAG: hypothetical protein AB7G13_28785 [Lautropia sp.]
MYTIARTRTYYNRRQPVRDTVCDAETGRPLEFASRRTAQRWIDEADAEQYRQGHDEYGRPEYRIAQT